MIKNHFISNTRDWLKFYRLSGVTFYDCINTMYQCLFLRDIEPLRGNNKLTREVTQSNFFLPPFWKGVSTKRKEFAPCGSKFFPFRVDPFQKGPGMQKSKWKSQKFFPLSKVAENLPSVSLTHFSLEAQKRMTDKQCRPRSDAKECGIWSEFQLVVKSFAILLWKYLNHTAWHT